MDNAQSTVTGVGLSPESPTHLAAWGLRTDAHLLWGNISNVTSLESKCQGGCQPIPASMSAYFMIYKRFWGKNGFVFKGIGGKRLCDPNCTLMEMSPLLG